MAQGSQANGRVPPQGIRVRVSQSLASRLSDSNASGHDPVGDGPIVAHMAPRSHGSRCQLRGGMPYGPPDALGALSGWLIADDGSGPRRGGLPFRGEDRSWRVAIRCVGVSGREDRGAAVVHPQRLATIVPRW